MGMFDYINFEVELPDNLPKEGWQTKDLECFLDNYKIDSSKRLLREDYRLYENPLQRDVYGTKLPYFERIDKKWVDTNYHGMLTLCNLVDGEFFQIELKFTDGNLVDIKVE